MKAWPQWVTDIASAISKTEVRQEKYCGLYDAILNGFFTSQQEIYFVEPQYNHNQWNDTCHQKFTSSLLVYAVTEDVPIPVLYIDLRSPSELAVPASRAKAHVELEEWLKVFSSESPIGTVYGISTFGTYYRKYASGKSESLDVADSQSLWRNILSSGGLDDFLETVKSINELLTQYKKRSPSETSISTEHQVLNGTQRAQAIREAIRAKLGASLGTIAEQDKCGYKLWINGETARVHKEYANNFTERHKRMQLMVQTWNSMSEEEKRPFKDEGSRIKQLTAVSFDHSD